MDQQLVLVISNCETVIDCVSRSLSRYEILTVSSAESALEVYQQHISRIRVVLLALKLDFVSGILLLREMKHISLIPEIILISDQKDASCSVNAIKDGAFDFLVRPVDEEELVNVVDQALESAVSTERVQTMVNFIDDSVINKDKRAQLDFSLNNHSEDQFFLKMIFDSDDFFNVFMEFSDYKSSKDFLFFNLFKTQFTNFINQQTSADLLVIDHNMQALIQYDDFLSDQYNLHHAVSGEQAFELMTQFSHIKLVLLDVFLKGYQLVDFIVEFKARYPDVVIIVITFFELIDSAVLALRAGASDYLNKPLLKHDLCSTLNMALKRHYFDSFFPEFKKNFIDNYLTDGVKLELLDRLFLKRRERNSSISMKEVYMFFPELSYSSISADTVLSTQVFEKGSRSFVLSLRKRCEGATLKEG